MGGKASPLSWVLASDLVIEGLARVTGMPAPTYVGDLAALLVSGAHATAAQTFMLAAGHCAGDGDAQMPPVACRRISPDKWRARERVPVAVAGAAAGRVVSGLPDMLACMLWAGVRFSVVANLCTCAGKTCLAL